MNEAEKYDLEIIKAVNDSNDVFTLNMIDEYYSILERLENLIQKRKKGN